MLKMIIHDVADSSIDLGKVPAFTDGTPENTIYWDAMNRDQVRAFWDEAMRRIAKYDGPAAIRACGILGALEDTYPEWVEEFESEL